MTIDPDLGAMLPCPFCGKQPVLHDNDWCDPPEWSVMCVCRSRDTTKESAVQAWNRRCDTSQDAAVAAALDRAKQACVDEGRRLGGGRGNLSAAASDCAEAVAALITPAQSSALSVRPFGADRCMDCGCEYGSIALDFVLSKAQWLSIHPEDGGVLCGNCIAHRASRLPHVINITCAIAFGDDFNNGPPSLVSKETLSARLAEERERGANEAAGRDSERARDETWLEAVRLVADATDLKHASDMISERIAVRRVRERRGYHFMPEGGWTCFQCGEPFRSVEAAQLHFGADPRNPAACALAQERERALEEAMRIAWAKADNRNSTDPREICFEIYNGIRALKAKPEGGS